MIYEKTKVKRWSITVKKRRLTWLGHAEAKRYSSQNCSRNSLEKCAKTQRKNQDNMEIQLEINTNGENNLMFSELEKLCQDKSLWKRQVHHMMLNTTNM